MGLLIFTKMNHSFTKDFFYTKWKIFIDTLPYFMHNNSSKKYSNKFSIKTQGLRCEKRYNPCYTSVGEPVCQNRGTCYMNFGTVPPYQCQCRRGFSGTNCEIAPTTTQAPTTVPTTAFVCTDRDPTACPYYASNNFCSSFYYINRTPIPVYCAKSCNRCSTVTNSPITSSRPCVDTQQSCTFWGATGNCGLLPDQTLCSKSCGLC